MEMMMKTAWRGMAAMLTYANTSAYGTKAKTTPIPGPSMLCFVKLTMLHICHESIIYGYISISIAWHWIKWGKWWHRGGRGYLRCLRWRQISQESSTLPRLPNNRRLDVIVSIWRILHHVSSLQTHFMKLHVQLLPLHCCPNNEHPIFFIQYWMKFFSAFYQYIWSN